jgi:hypothetical protein
MITGRSTGLTFGYIEIKNEMSRYQGFEGIYCHLPKRGGSVFLGKRLHVITQKKKQYCGV